MIDSIKFQEAKSLMNTAQSNKAQAEKLNLPKKYEDAISNLEAAIKLLIGQLESTEKIYDSSNNFHKSYRHDLAVELADCYGMAGGIYRRMGLLNKAKDMYDEGYKYESEPKYEIENSYNTVNRIAVCVLNGNAIPELLDDIEKGINIILSQVKGVRRREWWAWADLGLLYLLSQNENAALLAYSEFMNTGALRKHFESTIDVLNDLKNQIHEANPLVASSLTNGINFLTAEKSKTTL